MKTPKTEKTEVDLLKPIQLPDTVEGDCFGTEEYDPQHKDCSICADIELCGIKFQGLIQKKKNVFEKENGPLLDQTDFEGVDFGKVESLALRYQDDGSPMTFEELVELVSQLASTKDDIAVVEYLKRTIPNTRLILKEGQVHVR